MKIENLVPLKNVSEDKFRELFNKNSNLAWNLRHYAESCEVDYVREVLGYLDKDGSWTSWECGIYSKCHFSARHDRTTLKVMALGCLKIQNDFGFFNETTDPILIETLAVLAGQYANNTDPDKDDDILDRAYAAMDAVSAVITERLKEIFEFWESDENLLKERREDFLECYGDVIYLNPTNDRLMELKSLDSWNF